MSTDPLPLDSPRWKELEHAYGSAESIPGLLRLAERDPDRALTDDETVVWDLTKGEQVVPKGSAARYSLWSALCHQGDIYDASYAAAPHLVRLAERFSAPERACLLALATGIELVRLAERGPPVPVDLKPAYEAAWKRVPALVMGVVEENWTDVAACSLLAALAIAKGQQRLGQLVADPTQAVTTPEGETCGLDELELG